MAARIQQVQDFLGQKILIENVSSYVSFRESEGTEWEFLVAVTEQADCDILLDINNIYVTARNHGIDPVEYINNVPIDSVREFHLAGYEDHGTHLLDTHGARVYPPVWELYQHAISRFGTVPTLIEWDTRIPDFEVLQREAETADQYMHQVQRHVA